MSNAVYPTLPGLTWPVTRTPAWNTTVKRAPSGREWRSTARLYPLHRYSLSYEFLRDTAALAEFQTLFGFYNARQGAFDSFLFNNIKDNAVTAQQFGTGDGATRAFQLLRSLGGFNEPVYDLAAVPAISINGTLQSAATYAISSTGLVTFTVAPAAAAVITWTGSYYWRVRFETDELAFDQFMQQFWSTGKVPFVQVRP
ncbi:MAG: DUF2460 domain-containing protein [Leptothrix sp. (in: b-proteobacteria)]